MDISNLVGVLNRDKTVHTVTKVMSKSHVIRLTRIGKRDRRDRQDSYRLTIGGPNYATRAFIKYAIEAGEPFPIKKIWLTRYANLKKSA